MVSRRLQKKSLRQRKWFYPLLIAAFTVAVLGVLEATGITHLVHHKYQSGPTATTSKLRQPNSIDYSAANQSDNNANDVRKSSPNPATTLDNGPTSSGSSNPLGVIIINARRSGTDVRVGNLINGTTSGTCTLSATQSGQVPPAPVTAQVQQDVNNYDCGIMHISLPDTGTWQLKLLVTNDSNSASATTTVEAS